MLASDVDSDGSDSEADATRRDSAEHDLSKTMLENLDRMEDMLQRESVGEAAATTQRAAASMAAAAASSSRTGGSGGSTLREAMDAEVGGGNAPAEQKRDIPHSAPPDSHGMGASVQADAISDGGSASDDEITLRMTPRDDISKAVDSPATGGRRRDTMTSLMSNMMRGMRPFSTPAPTTSAQKEDSKMPEQEEEGKQELAAAVAAADPSRGPRQSLAALEHPRRAPRHGGARSGKEDSAQRMRSLLLSIDAMKEAIIQQAMARDRKATTRHRRPRRTSQGTRKDKIRRAAKAHVEKMKFVREMSKSGMSREAFLALDNELQRLLWEHCNDIIWSMIIRSLGRKHRHIVGRVADGDGVGAYECIVLLGNDRSAGAKSSILSELMSLQMRSTGSAEAPASILTYYDALNDLNSEYAKANGNVGVSQDILRTKLLQLPESYKFALQCIDENDIEAERLGRPQKTCQEIVDYLVAFENKIRRRRASNRHHPASRRAFKKAPRRVGRAYYTSAAGQRPSRGGKQGSRKPERNPHRHMRGRKARIAIQRARGGKPNGGRGAGSKRTTTCWGCGEIGHISRDCPNKHKWNGHSRGGDRLSGQKMAYRMGRVYHTKPSSKHHSECAIPRATLATCFSRSEETTRHGHWRPVFAKDSCLTPARLATSRQWRTSSPTTSTRTRT